MQYQNQKLKLQSQNTGEDAEGKPQAISYSVEIRLICGTINLLFSLLQLRINLNKSKLAGKSLWKEVWIYLDTIYFIVTILLAALLFSENLYQQYPGAFRLLESLLGLTLWTKSLYYFQLVDNISPLIHTIFFTLKSIGYFMVTYCVALFAFANAFYLLGRNQLIFDKEIKTEDRPEYSSVWGSLSTVFKLCLGEVQFSVGFQKSQAVPLWIVFVMASFVLVTHMLNMLIGIMGDSRSKYREIETQMILKNKLKFIIENWYRDAFG